MYLIRKPFLGLKLGSLLAFVAFAALMLFLIEAHVYCNDTIFSSTGALQCQPPLLALSAVFLLPAVLLTFLSGLDGIIMASGVPPLFFGVFAVGSYFFIGMAGGWLLSRVRG